jgi:hypothetical protein
VACTQDSLSVHIRRVPALHWHAPSSLLTFHLTPVEHLVYFDQAFMGNQKARISVLESGF